MKSKLSTTILVILLAAANVIAKEETPKTEPIALTIVWDASSSLRPNWTEIGSLSRQTISSLKADDYLEVISAHSSRPRLRAAQFIQSGNADEAESISSLLKNIKCPLIADADAGKALELAFNRMDRFWSKDPNKTVIAIVFTDGKLKNSEVKKIRQISTEMCDRGWQLYLTGTYQTNKNLLVSASQGLFKWSLITQANPSLWIEALRKEKTIIKEKPSQEQAPPQEPKATVIEPPREPNQTTSPDNSESSKSEKTESAKYKIETSIDQKVSISESSEKITASLKIPPKEVPKIAEEPSSSEVSESPSINPKKDTIEPNEEARSAVNNIASTELSEQKTSIVTKSRNFFVKYLWWILLPIIICFTTITVVWYAAAKKASLWKAKIVSQIGTNNPQEPSILIAKLNGQTFRLGKLNHFKGFHAGSGPNNTIKINDKSIENQHLKIYRKGKDLMLKNLSRSPLTANGIDIKAHGKSRLSLPAAIKLNDKITLNLLRVHPKKSSDKQESENELKLQEKEILV